MGKELLLSRDTLEIGAQYAVMQEDIPGFERYMAQLQTYYHDHQGDLPDSPFQYQLLGLNLLCLLSQNRVAEFHTELERLPAHEVQSNVYIKHPVSLEQYIMEGSYNKVILTVAVDFNLSPSLQNDYFIIPGNSGAVGKGQCSRRVL